jgi:hypothetical protein
MLELPPQLFFFQVLSEASLIQDTIMLGQHVNNLVKLSLEVKIEN